MNILDTIKMMESEDYKERFKAEYYQLKIRFEKLSEMLLKWNKNELSFTPTCKKSIYIEQLKEMYRYMLILEQRAIIEKTDL